MTCFYKFDIYIPQNSIRCKNSFTIVFTNHDKRGSYNINLSPFIQCAYCFKGYQTNIAKFEPHNTEGMHSSEKKNEFLTISTKETALYLDNGFELMHVVGETTIYDTSVE